MRRCWILRLRINTISTVEVGERNGRYPNQGSWKIPTDAYGYGQSLDTIIGLERGLWEGQKDFDRNYFSKAAR